MDRQKMSWGRCGHSDRCTENGEERRCPWGTWETLFSYLKRFEHEMWVVERLWTTCSSLTVHHVSVFFFFNSFYCPIWKNTNSKYSFEQAEILYLTSWAVASMNTHVPKLPDFQWKLQASLTSFSSNAHGEATMPPVLIFTFISHESLLLNVHA